MKKVLFGIAVILFAILLRISDPLWLPIIADVMSEGWFTALVGLVGLVIAGIGAFRQDK